MASDTDAKPGIRVGGGRSAVEIFLVFLRLGLTSFGGPVAHIGYFRDEFVGRRKWLDDRTYADLVALCQFTPGAASSKVGIGIGLAMGGLPGAGAAWLAFTLPSALALILFAFGISTYAQVIDAGVLHGLKVVAVAVVALAVWTMARNLCPDAPRATVAIAAALATTAAPTSLAQVFAIVGGGLVGLAFLKGPEGGEPVPMPAGLGRISGAGGRRRRRIFANSVNICSHSTPDTGFAYYPPRPIRPAAGEPGAVRGGVRRGGRGDRGRGSNAIL
jgi:chromate transporter